MGHPRWMNTESSILPLTPDRLFQMTCGWLMSAGGSKEKGSSAGKEEQPSPQPEKQGRPQTAAAPTFGRHRRSRSGTQIPTVPGSEAGAEAEEEPAENLLEEEPGHQPASKQQGLHCLSDLHTCEDGVCCADLSQPHICISEILCHSWEAIITLHRALS